MAGTRTPSTAADANPNELIVIEHSDGDVNGQGLCTRHQLEVVWGPLGWTEVKDAAVQDVVADRVAIYEEAADAAASASTGV